MYDQVSLTIEGDTIRFTPDGRLAVVDAIAALSEDKCPSCVWEILRRNNPQLEHILENYSFGEGDPVDVADSGGWEVIQGLLLDYLTGGSA